jgi:5-methylcytosine-specific restriction endonuclease McrA
MSGKFCPHCETEKPLTEFYKTTKGGIMQACKACHNARTNAWREKNPKAVAQIHARSRKRRADKILEEQRAWRERNKEYVQQRWAKYYAKNADRLKKRASEYGKENRAKRTEFTRLKRLADPMPHRMEARRRKALKRGADSTASRLTAAEWRAIVAYFNGHCAYCIRPFDNLTVEHMTPLSRGGLHSVENVVPACASCNSRKSTKGLLEFAAYEQ